MLEMVAYRPEAGYKAFDASRDARPMLELRLADGLCYALPYAFLRAVRADLRNPAGQTITLFHAVGEATITGRNLHELKDKLAAQAVNWLRALGPGEPAPEEAATVITGLDFVPAAQ